MTRPELTAFLDQAGAASAHAEDILHAMAAAGLGEPRHQTPPKPIRDVLGRTRARILGRALAGQPTLCEHLSTSAPSVAWWLAWSPDLLRCLDCATAAGSKIQGTPEDLRCDRCHRIGRLIHNEVVCLPPVVVDLAGTPLAAIPAVLLMAGLCPPCHRKLQRKATP
jgi:hypothetical protein